MVREEHPKLEFVYPAIPESFANDHASYQQAVRSVCKIKSHLPEIRKLVNFCTPISLFFIFRRTLAFLVRLLAGFPLLVRPDGFHLQFAVSLSLLPQICAIDDPRFHCLEVATSGVSKDVLDLPVH